jgi:hypothetical protein
LRKKLFGLIEIKLKDRGSNKNSVQTGWGYMSTIHLDILGIIHECKDIAAIISR